MTQTWPRVDMVQRALPGTDGSKSVLVLHMCAPSNYSQRITIATHRLHSGRRRHHDIQLTRAQVLELIDHLIDRVDTMTDDIPATPPQGEQIHNPIR
jgi:hypothetical protein